MKYNLQEEIDGSLTLLTKDQHETFFGSDFQFSNSIHHPLPAGMKISLIGMVLIGFPIAVLSRGLKFLNTKIRNVSS